MHDNGRRRVPRIARWWVGAGLALALAGPAFAGPASAATAHHSPRRADSARPLLVRSGTGNDATATFTAPADGWELNYSYNCANLAEHVGDFLVVVLRTPGPGSLTILQDRPVRAYGPSGRGIVRYRTGGAGVFLQVSSDCAWALQASR
jgi:hypothetical protein